MILVIYTLAVWRAVDEALDTVSRFSGAADPSAELVSALTAGSVDELNRLDLRKISESVIISSVRWVTASCGGLGVVSWHSWWRVPIVIAERTNGPTDRC
jgi:hypothetical protein